MGDVCVCPYLCVLCSGVVLSSLLYKTLIPGHLYRSNSQGVNELTHSPSSPYLSLKPQVMKVAMAARSSVQSREGCKLLKHPSF